MTFILRRGFDSDIEKIRLYADKFNLDSKDMNARKFYIVSKTGTMAGFGRTRKYKNICELSTIGVLEEFRGQGIGKMIVNKLLGDASTDEIWLTTIIPEYFEQFGFRVNSKAPEELILKSQRICRRFGKSVELNAYMRLEK